MIFDFRVRPPYRGFCDTGLYSPWGMEADSRQWPALSFGRVVPPSVLEHSMDHFVSEMDSAGIDRALVMGRKAADGSGWVENTDISELVREDPKRRFEGFAAIDVTDADRAIEDGRHAIEELGLTGIAMEPALAKVPTHVDDESVHRILDGLASLKVPIAITSSIMIGPDLSYSDPNRIMHLADRHPDINFVVVHASWPFVQEIVAVAFRYRNVYLVPDFYGYIEDFPFSEGYRSATAMFLRHRVLFASSYPVRPLAEAVEGMHKWQLSDEVLEMVLERNARELLQL